MTTYFENLQSLVPDVQTSLGARGIDARHLVFGGELPEERVTIPTDARSEFLANRAMGDWAENTLTDGIRNSRMAIEVSHYGDIDKIAAGEPGFKESYRKAKEETRKFGKRPDLLLFASGAGVPADMTDLPRDQADAHARKAIAGVEVRSSKFKAEKYIAVRKADKQKTGRASGRETPSFTVKVEDLRVVFRWIEVVGVQQVYAQVFFDSCFAIDIASIFEIVASSDLKKFKIESPEKSQNKATIMIPITSGHKIGVFLTAPEFAVSVRETRTGRIDAYVRPTGGVLEINESNLNQVLHQSKR
jgi:hypothetical protein